MTRTDAPAKRIEVRETDGVLHVVNTQACARAVQLVDDGEHCAVIGVRYSEKTVLLRDIEEMLRHRGHYHCVAIDFRRLEGARSMSSVVGIAHPIREQLAAIIGDDKLPEVAGTDELQFYRFLQAAIEANDRSIVLLITGLERLPMPIVRALLRTVRALSMQTSRRFSMIIASAFRLYDLALGPTSPFNIAKSIIVRDLSAAESAAFVDALARKHGIRFDEDAQQRLLDATNGDRSMIRELFKVVSEIPRQITRDDVETRIANLIEPGDAPPAIPAAIHALESKAGLLFSGLQVLRRGTAPRSELTLGEYASDIDPLELTGAFRQITDDGIPKFTVRSEIYERVLKRHFTSRRAVEALRTLGDWAHAFEYLADLSHDNDDARETARSLLVDSIYASRNEQDAHESLAERLGLVLPARAVAVYLVDEEKWELERVSMWPLEGDLPDCLPLKGSSRFVATFKGKHSPVSEQDAGYVIQLQDAYQPPIGVVWTDGLQALAHDDFMTAQDYLGLVARALGQLRRREVQMAEPYRQYTDTKLQFETHDDASEAWLGYVRRVFKGADAAYVFDWSEDKQHLSISAHNGATPEAEIDKISLRREEGYVGWAFTNRQPVLISDAEADKRTKFFEREGLIREKSALCAPIEVWGKVIGALVVVSTTRNSAFNAEELDLLTAFALALGTRVHVMRANRKLHECSLHINQSEDVKTIFRTTVDAIRQITAVSAANLWMLYAGGDLSRRLTDEPRLSCSLDMDAGFDRKYQPRSDGLTYQAMSQREPITAVAAEHERGMNVCFIARNVQAMVALPLITHDDVQGVLNLHYFEPHTFSSNETNTLSLFANQLALALENAEQRRDMKIKEAVFSMGLEFSNLAHRLKQQVAALQSVAFGLRNALKDRPDVNPKLDELDRYARNIGDVPDHTVIFGPRRLKTLDLTVLIETFVRDWSMNTEITAEVHGAESTMVRANDDDLRTVLETLARNAHNAMKGRQRQHLTVGVQRTGDRVIVYWSDTGGGVDPDIEHLLFEEPIIHGSGARGLGVGLLLAQRLVRRYRGNIRMKNTSASGTTFEFWLPYATPTEGGTTA